jgi:hypothetical protein
MVSKAKRTSPEQYRAQWARALEAFGIWVPVLVVIPVANKWPTAFWHAFGSGSLFAAATLILLTFLASDEVSVRRIFMILMLMCLALTSHGMLMYRLVDESDVHHATAFDADSLWIWLSVILFLLLAAIRTKLLLRERTDFSE